MNDADELLKEVQEKYGIIIHDYNDLSRLSDEDKGRIVDHFRKAAESSMMKMVLGDPTKPKPQGVIRAKKEKIVTLQIPKGDRFRNNRKPIGRNSLCPCGSGKKFKICCLRPKKEI
jgi:hypothetical protein